jgi:hypothetical protein
MANLWVDGLARYGDQIARMTESGPSQGWAEVTSAFSLSTTQTRTGPRSLRIAAAATQNNCRRVFGVPLQEIYFGYAFFATALPTADAFPLFTVPKTIGVALAQFRDASNRTQLSVFLRTDGSIAVVQRGETGLSQVVGTFLGQSLPVIGAGAWQHIEIYLKCDPVEGAVEIRVNEVTVLNLTDVDTAHYSPVEISQVSVAQHNPGGGPYYFADFYANDVTDDGSGGDTFYGDVKVGTIFPNGDTTQADFNLSTGSDGFDLLNDAPPNDSTFLSAATTARSDFDLQNSPADAVLILTVRPFARARKEDAGAANILPRIRSGASESTGRSSPVTTAFAYYDSNVPFNPATSAPWTPGELDDAIFILERDL